MNINKKLKPEIDKLIETKEINMNIADMLLSIYPYKDAIKGKQLEKEAVFTQILDFFGIPEDDEESIEIATKYIKDNLDKCDLKEYQNNEYYLKVTPKEYYSKEYELKYLSYAPYQLFARDDVSITSYPYEEIYNVGYFDKQYKYLALIKNDEIWMSINPNEITTMKPFIKDAKGNVLVMGLGMGYIAYMMSLKEEVKSITIIEKDINIINIFNKHLFSFFPNKNKIKIIHDDAFRYLENAKKFDYYFFDLWHNPEDGLPMYLQAESYAKSHSLVFNYWLKDSLNAMKRRCLITIFEEYFMGYKEKDYKFAKTQMDQNINYLYNLIKDIDIQTIEDLKKILD